MFQVKPSWRFLSAVIAVGVITGIYGLKIVPEACIEDCSCDSVKDNRDLSTKEKKALAVCGSDGVTYESLCALLCQHCTNNITLETRYANASKIRMAFKYCNRTDVPPVWKKLWRPKTPKPTGSTTTPTTPKPKRTTTKPTPPPYVGPPTTEAPLCDNDEKNWIKLGDATKTISFKNVTYPIKMVHLFACVKKKKGSSDKDKIDKITDKVNEKVEQFEKMTDKIEDKVDKMQDKLHDKMRKRKAIYSDESKSQELCFGRCSCSHVRNYVCGTNGVTYHNKCKLRCAACEKGIVLKVLHKGKCQLREL